MLTIQQIGLMVGVIAALSFVIWRVIYYMTYDVRSQVFGVTDWMGRADTNAVALTFDDGPSDDTEAALDVLKSYGVKATFFMVGREVEKRPGVARRIVAEGHEVGNHSYTHPIYLFCTPRRTGEELRCTQDVIANVTGIRPTSSRPPCGVRTPSYFKATRELGLRTIQWTVAGGDWQKKSAAEIAHLVLKDTKAGSIILLHDGDSRLKRDRKPTVAALPLIIEGLKLRGLRVAPLAEILSEANAKGSGDVFEARASLTQVETQREV